MHLVCSPSLCPGRGAFRLQIIKASSPEIWSETILAVSSWRGSRVAYFWVTSLGLIGRRRRVGGFFPLNQAFGDDLRRLQRRLAQGRVFDDLALHARGLALQLVAQHL